MERLWKKRGNHASVLDVLMSSSGQSKEELLNPERDPYLPGLDRVADTIWNYIREYPDAPVTIIADYDEDGMASAEIMLMLFKRLLGRWVDVIIPNRIKDGYGFHMSFIGRCAISDGKGMIVTVDNGVTAVEETKAAKNKGFKVVIVDHHQPLESGELPDADALLDPHTVAGNHFKDYCAAGLSLRIARELLKRAGMEDETFMKKLTAFAATATITDVVPMIGDNRNIVKDGLQIMKMRECTKAMNMMLDLLQLNDPNEEDIGFNLGPVFNAAGRMPDGDTDILVASMVEDTESESLRKLLTHYIALNEKRKKIVSEAGAKIKIPEGEYPVIAYVPDMPLGIVGILAGKLAESSGTAAFVLADSGEQGIIKGSARAGESDVHLKDMLDFCNDLLISHGGHMKAAGLSLNVENLDSFRARCRQFMEQKGCASKLENILWYDLEIAAPQIAEINRELQLYAPFGEKVAKPVFMIRDFTCLPGNNGQPYRDSQKAQDWISFNGTYANASSFHGIKNRWIGAGCPLSMTFIGTLGINEFKNRRRNEIRLLDFKPDTNSVQPDNKENTQYQPDLNRRKEGEIVMDNSMNQPIKTASYGKALREIPVGCKDIVTALLMAVEEGVTSQGSVFCKLTISDYTKDTQSANIWDISRETLEAMGILPGNLYSFAVSVKNYQDKRSYTIQGKSRDTDIMRPPQDAKIEDFIPSAPFETTELYDLVLKYVETFCSPALKELTAKIYADQKNKLLYWGAAKTNHHSYRGGLMWHTASMVEEAYGLMMGKRFETLNKSIVISACALHDIGKLFELQTDTLGTSDYTEAGNMFGHLLIGYDLIRDYAKTMGILSDEEVKHLLHIIISHHGNQEWGAIKQPLTREANLVHHIDLLDSSDEEFCEEYDNLQPGEMMGSVSHVLKRAVIRPAFSK